MTKLAKLGLLITLSGMTTIGFAAPSCSSLQTAGTKDNVIETLAGTKISPATVNSCIQQCSQKSDAAACSSALNNVLFATYYNNAINALPDPKNNYDTSSNNISGNSGFGSQAPVTPPFNPATQYDRNPYTTQNPVESTKSYFNQGSGINPEQSNKPYMFDQ